MKDERWSQVSIRSIVLLMLLLFLSFLLKFLIGLMFNCIFEMVLSVRFFNWSYWCYVLIIGVQLELFRRFYFLMISLFVVQRCYYHRILLCLRLFSFIRRYGIQFAISALMVNFLWVMISLMLRVILTIVVVIFTWVTLVLNYIGENFTPYLSVIVLVDNFLR